ncbi:MAG TPA: hypothetical protein VIO94_11015 [Phenylobacterium sp.]
MKRVLLLCAALALGGCTQFNTAEGKRLAARDLPDPAQAQFRNIVVGKKVVCGQISGADRFGGRTEFKGFVAQLDTGAVLHEPDLEPAGPLPPFQQAMAELDQGASLLDFSATSFELCGQSVASGAFATAHKLIAREAGLKAIPRLDNEQL